MKNGKLSAKRLAGTSILLALVIVLQAVGAVIAIGPVQLNFTLIPIVLGAMIFGPSVGAFLGFASGVVVLIQVMSGGSVFYALIWNGDPVVTTLTCLIKTTAAGWLCGALYNLIAKKNEVVALFVASAIVPVVNTALFVLGCLCMTNSVYSMASGENVFVFVLVSLVTFNFFAELGVNLILAPALRTVYKQIKIK